MLASLAVRCGGGVPRGTRLLVFLPQPPPAKLSNVREKAFRRCAGRLAVFAMATDKKIQLYSANTPNGAKVSIALEEMGLPYDAHMVDIFKNDQFTPEFIAINPNSKIPAIVDPNGPGGEEVPIMESGAILQYLAKKTGQFGGSTEKAQLFVAQWLFFQMASIGPMFGQFGHFFKYAKDKCDHPYPVERYTNEAKRLLGVLEKQLEGNDYITGDEYTIADMAIFPWVRCLDVAYEGRQQLDLDKFPKVDAYVRRCFARPAVRKGVDVCPMGLDWYKNLEVP
eukprot:jgi/Chlat1/8877/Chrsp92S08192